jgi:hypothetical protein
MRNKVVKQLRRQAKALFPDAEYADGVTVKVTKSFKGMPLPSEYDRDQYQLNPFCIKALVKGMKRNYARAA